MVESPAKKKHCCSVCAKPSETIICQRCEEKIRGEVVDKKRNIERAGKTDSSH